MQYYSNPSVKYEPSTSQYRKQRKQEWNKRKKATKLAKAAYQKQKRQENKRRKRQLAAKRRLRILSRLRLLNPFRKLRFKSLAPKTAEILYRLTLSLSILLAIAFASLAFFRVRTIEVIGCAQCSAAMVAEATDVQLGDRLFFTNRQQIADGILEKIPYADTVRVLRKFPSTLSIEITETTPVGAVIYRNVSYLINDRCKLLEYQPASSEKSTLIIEGLSVGLSVPGKEITLSNHLYTESLSTLLLTLEDFGLQGSVSHIDMTKLYSINFLYEGRLLVEIGDVSSLERKLELFKELQSRLGSQVRGTLDISEVGRASFTLSN